MSITKRDVQYLAKLARLDLSKAELKKYQKQLAEILDYVGQLRKAETKNVKPCLSRLWRDESGTNLVNVFRQDEEKQTNKQRREKLLNSAPNRQGDFIKTKAVFEKSL